MRCSCGTPIRTSLRDPEFGRCSNCGAWFVDDEVYDL